MSETEPRAIIFDRYSATFPVPSTHSCPRRARFEWCERHPKSGRPNTAWGDWLPHEPNYPHRHLKYEGSLRFELTGGDLVPRAGQFFFKRYVPERPAEWRREMAAIRAEYG